MNYLDKIKLKPLKVRKDILKVVNEQRNKPVTLEEAREQVKKFVRRA